MSSNAYRPEVRDIQKRFEERSGSGDRLAAPAPDSGLNSQSFQSQQDSAIDLLRSEKESTSIHKELETGKRLKVEEHEELDEGISSMRPPEPSQSLPTAFEEKVESGEDSKYEDDEGTNITEAFPEPVEPVSRVFFDDESEYTLGQCAAHYFATSEDARYLLAPYCSFIAAKDDEGDTALHTAIIHNKPAVLHELMQSLGFYLPYCINTQNKLGQTPLHLAAALKQSYVVRLLMDGGARLDIQDRKGDSPLHVACRLGDVRSLTEMLKEISEPGMVGESQPFDISDLSQLNFDGFAPIHLAVLSQSAACAQCLCIAGADVDVEDGKSGRRALHHAVELDNLLLMTTLIYDCNADVNAANFDGSTPLHFAAGRGLNAATALLIASGADTAVWNYEGDSPHDISINKDISHLCVPTREREDVMEVTGGVSQMNICAASL